MANIINFDRSDDWYDAPLKTVSEVDLRDFNSQMAKQYQGFFNSITPHYYNKSTFIRLRNANTGMYGGAYVPYGIWGSGDNLRREFTALGSIIDTDNDDNDIYKPDMWDYAIYYELMPVSEYDYQASDISANPALYDNVITVSVGCTPNSGRNIISGLGTHTTAIRGKGVAPTPTHNYDNWLVVKTWVVYEREEGDRYARTKTGDGTFTNNVLPAVCFDINGVHWFNITDYNSKPRSWNGNSQAIILANISDAKSSWLSLRVLCDWIGVQLERIEEEYVILNQPTTIRHKSTLGDNIKILSPERNDSKLEKWFEDGNEVIYKYSDEFGILAFKSEADFLAFLADWGITTRISNNLDDVKNLDGDEFPNATPGGFVPGGGADSGFNNNPTITQVPSFPDNTSDKVEPITPNVSAINAASAYALSLTSVKSLFNWLMTDDFTKNISNLFSDKLSALDDLKILPFDLSQHDPLHSEFSSTLTVANVSTAIECYKILPAYNCIVDGGNYFYNAYWGNANDYTSSTYFLYVPYAGVVEMSPSHVVNCNIRLQYALDIMSGSATAIVYSNDVLVKTIPCQMGQSVPITYTNTNQRQIKNALTALNTVNSLASTVSGVAVNAATGNVGGAVSSGIGGLLGIGTNIAQNALTNPLVIGSTGSFSGNTSLVMPQTAFLIISRTQLSIPSDRNKLAGQPSNITSTINSFVGSGFVQINVGHINTTATTEEQNQIIATLSAGIFI